MLAKVFDKGQIVIPASLIKKYNIKIGDKVNIIVEEDGIKIIPLKKNLDVKELLGLFYKYSQNKPFPKETEIEKEEIISKMLDLVSFYGLYMKDIRVIERTLEIWKDYSL